MPDRPAPKEAKIEISAEMIDAGEETIWARVGGAADLGGYFSARDLAVEVYRSMVGGLDCSKRNPTEDKNH